MNKEDIYNKEGNFPPYPYYEEDEIDLFELFEIIWKKRVFVGVITTLITVAAIIYALIATPIYRSKATILPVSSSGSSISIPSEIMGLASMAGISIPTSSGKGEIIVRLKSSLLYENIIKKYNLLPILFAEKWDVTSKKWTTDTPPPTLEDGIRTLKDMVNISEERKEGSIEVSVDFKEPEEAARLVKLILEETKRLIIKNTVDRAKKTLKQLKSILPTVEDPFIQQKIYALMAKQLETISLAKAGESFAFIVVDPPRVPEKRIKPKRKLIVVVAFVSGFILSIFLAFFMEWIKNAKQEYSRRLEDEVN